MMGEETVIIQRGDDLIDGVVDVSQDTACFVVDWLRMKYLTKLRVATASSTEEWPVVPPPACIISFRCSRTLKGRDSRKYDRKGEAEKVRLQIAQRFAIWESVSMWEEGRSIYTGMMNHSQRLQITIQRVADDDSVRIDEGIERTSK